MRWTRELTLAGIALTAGCLGPDSVRCGDYFCAGGLTCAPAPLYCASPDEVAACTGAADGTPCSTAPSPKGLCTASVCTPCVTEDLRCRYDEWVAMASPTTAALRGIWAAGPQDIYAVGDVGTVIHFDGVAWQTVTTEFKDLMLTDVWGASATDLYIVGGEQVYHYDGTWPSAAEMITTSTDIFGIAGSAANHVVAVGAAGTIRRYAGGSWLGVPASPTNAPLYAAWGLSETDFFAAGQAIYHLDDTAWTSVLAIPANGSVNAMSGTAGGDVFAAGQHAPAGVFVPLAIMRIGGTWAVQSVPEIPNAQLFGVWGAAANDVFAVGTGGVVLHHDGATWEPTNLGTTLNAITGTSSGDVYAVGDGGAIWRLSYAP